VIYWNPAHRPSFAFVGKAFPMDPFATTTYQPAAQLRSTGQGLVEYALVLLLIAVVVILLLTFIGNTVNNVFSRVGSGFNP
jgi:pilus assembly protein Flp/PilA